MDSVQKMFSSNTLFILGSGENLFIINSQQEEIISLQKGSQRITYIIKKKSNQGRAENQI